MHPAHPDQFNALAPQRPQSQPQQWVQPGYPAQFYPPQPAMQPVPSYPASPYPQQHAHPQAWQPAPPMPYPYVHPMQAYAGQFYPPQPSFAYPPQDAGPECEGEHRARADHEGVGGLLVRLDRGFRDHLFDPVFLGFARADGSESRSDQHGLERDRHEPGATLERTSPPGDEEPEAHERHDNRKRDSDPGRYSEGMASIRAPVSSSGFFPAWFRWTSMNSA